MKLYIQNVVLIVVHCVVTLPHVIHYTLCRGKNVLIGKLRLAVLQRFSSRSMSSLFVAIIITIDAILALGS